MSLCTLISKPAVTKRSIRSTPCCLIQGNCRVPFTTKEQEAWKIPDASRLELQHMKPYQCLLVSKESIFTVWRGNAWIDNLHLMLLRDAVAQDASLVEVPHFGLLHRKGCNVYLTNLTFQGDDKGSARVAIMLDPANTKEKRRTEVHHSLLVQGAWHASSSPNHLGLQDTLRMLIVPGRFWASIPHTLCIMHHFGVTHYASCTTLSYQWVQPTNS
jgi:hypothetical protein